MKMEIDKNLTLLQRLTALKSAAVSIITVALLLLSGTVSIAQDRRLDLMADYLLVSTGGAPLLQIIPHSIPAENEVGIIVFDAAITRDPHSVQAQPDAMDIAERALRGDRTAVRSLMDIDRRTTGSARSVRGRRQAERPAPLRVDPGMYVRNIVDAAAMTNLALRGDSRARVSINRGMLILNTGEIKNHLMANQIGIIAAKAVPVPRKTRFSAGRTDLSGLMNLAYEAWIERDLSLVAELENSTARAGIGFIEMNDDALTAGRDGVFLVVHTIGILAWDNGVEGSIGIAIPSLNYYDRLPQEEWVETEPEPVREPQEPEAQRELRFSPDRDPDPVPDTGSSPCIRERGSYPIPRVTNYSPREAVNSGGQITFSGTNFLTEQIMVCIGNVRLETVSSSANQLVVKAPETAVAGQLMISHGTAASNYILEDNFRISGLPVISSIEPESFGPGDIVTVRGSDLQLYPLTTRIDGASILDSFLKISRDPLHFGSDNFIRVTDFTRSADLSVITFRVHEIFSHQRSFIVEGRMVDYPVYFGQRISPQPDEVSGPLRFHSGETEGFDFAAPVVRWSPKTGTGEFSITSIKPPAWGNEHPMFVIASEDNPRGGIDVRFEGIGLDQARFMVGGEAVTAASSPDGREGFLVIKPSTPSGIVTATKEGQTVRYDDRPLIVIPEPAFLPNSLPEPPFTIQLNDEEYELRGWDLRPPSNVAGLSYRFHFDRFDRFDELRLHVLEHTESVIQFRVESLPSFEELSRFDQDARLEGTMHLTGEFNGVTRELWQMPYRIVR
jgi:hypothetical protein